MMYLLHGVCERVHIFSRSTRTNLYTAWNRVTIFVIDYITIGS